MFFLAGKYINSPTNSFTIGQQSIGSRKRRSKCFKESQIKTQPIKNFPFSLPLQLAKQQQIQNKQHDTLLLDQVTLRTLHEQLTAEYEDLQKEQELLRKLNRDLRSELRTYKENIASTEKKIAALEQEKEALKNESKSLSNLRTEHSKLKVFAIKTKFTVV